MRVLMAFGGEASPPRLQQVEALTKRLSGVEPTVASTLGGCIIRGNTRLIRVYREADPAELPEIALAPGGEVLWDSRFRVSAAPAKKLKAAGVGSDLTVRALGAGVYATLRRRIDPKARAPARAVHTLPSVWAGERLMAVPQLGIHQFGHEVGDARGGDPLCSSVFAAWARRGGL
jgi:tRNA(Ile)-lysidine synthase